MIDDREITLLHATGGPIKATIVSLTPELAEAKLMGEWWDEPELDVNVADAEIDRNWDWNAVEVQYPEGNVLLSEKLAVITGTGVDLAIQGGMIVSAEPIQSIAEPENRCFLVEFLFTAPRNREHVRADKQQWVIGVGTQLLIWAAWFSRDNGCGGRLRLDASPDFVGWYGRKGLQKLEIDPIVYEDVIYTPMELSVANAQTLLSAWDE